MSPSVPGELVRVLIATTQGPVEIEAILNLGTGQPSFVALGGSADLVSGLIRSYRNFVARGSGVIARSFDHDAFRLELSGEIHAGDSWQLAVFIAHALHKQGRLATKDDEAAALVWATGQVDYHLRIAEIGHVQEKIETSLTRLSDEGARGCAVHIALPLANGADADEGLRERLVALGVKIHEVDQVGQVLAALGIAWSEAADSEARPWRGSPYRGLQVFGETERAIFFGRGRAREEALARLRTADARGTAFLLIHGSSGAGKSSLARAGLFGDVMADGEDADEWRRAVLPPVQPDRSPLRALSQALATVLPELEPDADAREDTLVARMGEAPAALIAAITGVLASGGRQRRKLVLLVDQFEDVLLWVRDGEGDAERRQDRDTFAAMIERLAKSGSVSVLATLRSDLLARLEDSKPLSRLAADQRLYRLERPNRAALREMVLGPARLAGLTFEGQDASGTPLAEVLVEAAARSPDSLPLLQFALDRLYELRDRRSGAITAEAYERIGGIEGAVGRYAEDCTATAFGDDAAAIRALEDVILALARPDLERGTLVARTMLVEPSFDTGARQAVLQALAAARLVTLDEAPLGGRSLRVTHEALLTHWPRAQRLLEDRRSALDLREQLEGGATAWMEREKDSSYLLQAGSALSAARDLVDEGRIDLSARANAFVAASSDAARTKADAERQRLRDRAAAYRRRRLMAVAAAAALFIFAGAAGWLYLQIGRIDFDRALFTDDYGVTFSGFIDLKRNNVNIHGDIVFLNAKATPDFLGLKGHPSEGLLSLSYKITGKATEPLLNVNPLSAMTPVFLRHLILQHPDATMR